MATRTLSVTRAADRAVMAETVRTILAASNFASLTIEPENPESTLTARRRCVEYTHAGGIAVTIEFDGDSPMDREGTFCMAWHIGAKSDACMSDAFGRAVHGSINPHHFGKCTTFAHGFEELCETLSRAVACLDSGAAYDAERSAAKVAENGTWQEREARWEQYLQEFAAECAAKREAESVHA